VTRDACPWDVISMVLRLTARQVFWDKPASASGKGQQLSLAEALEFMLNKLGVQ
jgi:hypothetical protein